MITFRRAITLSIAGHVSLIALIALLTWLGISLSCRPPVKPETIMLQNVSMVVPEPEPAPPEPEPEPEPEPVPPPPDPEPIDVPPPPPDPEPTPPPPPEPERVISREPDPEPEVNPEQQRALEEIRERRRVREEEENRRQQEEAEDLQRQELERLRQQRQSTPPPVPEDQSVAVEQASELGLYASNLIRSISLHWHSSGDWAALDSYPRISITINKSGGFSNIHLVGSSGNANFDNAAVAALRQHPQGPRLPDFITEVPLTVTIVMLPR